MSEPKFTKGPWQTINISWDYSMIIDEDAARIAQVFIRDEVDEETQDKFEEIKEADANLIAAAPDMYEALEEVVALVCDSCLEYERFKELCHGRQKVVIAENPCNNCTNKVIKALRKARGETE